MKRSSKHCSVVVFNPMCGTSALVAALNATQSVTAPEEGDTVIMPVRVPAQRFLAGVTRALHLSDSDLIEYGASANWIDSFRAKTGAKGGGDLTTAALELCAALGLGEAPNFLQPQRSFDVEGVTVYVPQHALGAFISTDFRDVSIRYGESTKLRVPRATSTADLSKRVAAIYADDLVWLTCLPVWDARMRSVNVFERLPKAPTGVATVAQPAAEPPDVQTIPLPAKKKAKRKRTTRKRSGS